MKRTFIRQVILTAVVGSGRLPKEEIMVQLSGISHALGLEIRGQKLLDARHNQAMDFFLCWEEEIDDKQPFPDEDNQPLYKVISTLYQELRNFFLTKECDFCIQKYDPVTRRKSVFFSDMDSTMIANETLDDIAGKAGVGEEVAQITRSGIEGKIDFSESMKSRLQLLQGIPLQDFFKEVEQEIRYNPGAEILMKTLTRHDVSGYLITGGFDPLATLVKDKLGFQNLLCNHFQFHQGNCSGKWEGELVDGTKKLSAMKAYLVSRGLILEQSLAAGDGANDIPMLQAAGLGVAYRATSKVKSHIPHQINFTPLTTLLYYQGYSREEFSDGA